jgi:hypothetical protein
MKIDTEPKLAPPGAGLPAAELVIARLLFAWRRCFGNRESFNARFRQERTAIDVMVRACDEKSATQRVLIERPRGLEDSSRYWSVWMTLEHLRIVHGKITHVVGALARGVTPPGTGSTATVKPHPQMDAGVVSAYEKSCDDLLAAIAAVSNLDTSARYAHPWFGPLTAAGWHALAAGHLGVHRIQIERIVRGLPSLRA